MSFLMVIKLGKGQLEMGFPGVEVQLWQGDELRIQGVRSLPPALELSQLYQDWQSLYKALCFSLLPRRSLNQCLIEFDEEGIKQVSKRDFEGISHKLTEKINSWLESVEFSRIEKQVRSLIDRDSEIRVMLETEDEQLQRLPWHLWHFFSDYPHAEVALSPPEFRQITSPVRTGKDKVRILAILGNSDGIDVERDRTRLNELPDAEIRLLDQPERREFDRWLWDEEGWDILFFAGHSSTDTTEGIGYLEIKADERITIPDLKNALTTAISKGLKLAIFNSCDGLGLARQLADLHIPQAIVMRESVPDLVAQEFLKNFLGAFSGGKSFYLAVREARERLQGLEDKFPCASWLPVICQNPAQKPLTWQQLRAYRQNGDKSTPNKATEQSESVYIERPPIEEQCYQEIQKDGALIRIKASQKMGKTLLMNRIFEYAVTQQNYKTVSFDLLEPEEEVISDLDQFLRYFCSAVSWRLELTDKVDDFWQQPRSKTLKCRTYFEREILAHLDTNLVLGLDNVDRIFSAKYSSIASDFFGMLRSWYGNGRTLQTWKKLRMIVVYSTEDLPNLGIYQSPFNVGREIKPLELTATQIESLAQRYGLNWSTEQVKQLMALVEGHPYLIHEAINYLANYRDTSLEEFIQKASTAEGIYAPHFQSYLAILEQDQELIQTLKNIVFSDSPVSVAPKLSYKLESMGLIQKQGNQVKPRCQLYRLYFQMHLN